MEQARGEPRRLVIADGHAFKHLDGISMSAFGHQELRRLKRREDKFTEKTDDDGQEARDTKNKSPTDVLGRIATRQLSANR